jgi:hypothetical protein
MPYSRSATKKLLNASELDLFDTGRREAIGTLSTAQLRAKIARARRLRDKYRDLYRRQRVSTRARTGTKSGARGDANLRTGQKGEIFGELVGRFEKRLAQIEAAEQRARMQAVKRARRATQSAARRTGAVPAGAVKPLAPKARTGFMNPAAKSADTRRRLIQTGRVAVQAHTSSRGRRNQAKRDRRS